MWSPEKLNKKLRFLWIFADVESSKIMRKANLGFGKSKKRQRPEKARQRQRKCKGKTKARQRQRQDKGTAKAKARPKRHGKVKGEAEKERQCKGNSKAKAGPRRGQGKDKTTTTQRHGEANVALGLCVWPLSAFGFFAGGGKIGNLKNRKSETGILKSGNRNRKIGCLKIGVLAETYFVSEKNRFSQVRQENRFTKIGFHRFGRALYWTYTDFGKPFFLSNLVV